MSKQKASDMINAFSNAIVMLKEQTTIRETEIPNYAQGLVGLAFQPDLSQSMERQLELAGQNSELHRAALIEARKHTEHLASIAKSLESLAESMVVES